MDTPIYSKNPIREAIIDVKFAIPISLEQVQKYAAVYSQQFPTRKEIRTVGLSFDVNTETQKNQATVIGLQLWSADEKRVLQIRRDGFSCAQLKPYGTWKDFFAIFAQVWQQNEETWKAFEVSRLATRYINEFSLPIHQNGLGAYFHGLPSVPGRFDSQPSAFVSRMTLPPDQSSGTDAIVTFVYSGVEHDQYKLILDLDVFRNGKLSPDLKSIGARCDILNLETYTIFEKYLKEPAMEAIK